MKYESCVHRSDARQGPSWETPMVLGLVYGVASMLWRVLLLPVLIWRLCVAVGMGMVRAFARMLFGLFGLLLLGNFVFGMVYVLAYPWLR